MTKQEDKKVYLRKLLEISKDNPGYAEMDTYIKDYNKFMRILNYGFVRGGEEEKIYLYFYKNQLSVSGIVAKQKGKETLLKELHTILDKSFEYYETVLFPQYYEHIRIQSPKNQQIELSDKARINSIVGPLADLDAFLRELDNRWNEFSNFLYKSIDLVFSGDYSGENRPEFMMTDMFDKMVEEEISFYESREKEYSQSYYDESDFYYIGKNNNPYKNLYLYCLCSYIRNFYVMDIPKVTLGRFYELTNLQIPEQKSSYSLSDIANIYCSMSDCPYSKAYGKIKQQFRKSEFMQEHKKEGQYDFRNFELPLATYVYYSRKNHFEPTFEKLFDNYDPLMEYVYAPLLRSNIYGETINLNAYNRFYDFITKEFKRILKKTDDAYIDIFLKLLLQCPMRLFYRCSGLDVNTVIG